MEFVFLWILFGIATAVVANNKGHNIYTHFIGGLLLGPFGLIFALVQPKNQEKIDEKKVKTGKFKKCPKCAELIKVEANICRFCNHVFNNTNKINKSQNYLLGLFFSFIKMMLQR